MSFHSYDNNAYGPSHGGNGPSPYANYGHGTTPRDDFGVHQGNQQAPQMQPPQQNVRNYGQGHFDGRYGSGAQAAIAPEPYGAGTAGPFQPLQGHVPHLRRPSVGPLDAIKLFFKNYAVFHGRASRSEYWYVQLFYTLMSMALVIPAEMALASETNSGIGAVLYLLLALICLVGAVPMIALTVRRLHDTNKSGYFTLLSLVGSFGSLALYIMCAMKSEQGGARYDEPDKKYPVTQ